MKTYIGGILIGIIIFRSISISSNKFIADGSPWILEAVHIGTVKSGIIGYSGKYGRIPAFGIRYVFEYFVCILQPSG